MLQCLTVKKFYSHSLPGRKFEAAMDVNNAADKAMSSYSTASLSLNLLEKPALTGKIDISLMFNTSPCVTDKHEIPKLVH